jgi:hypothetical protein
VSVAKPAWYRAAIDGPVAMTTDSETTMCRGSASPSSRNSRGTFEQEDDMAGALDTVNSFLRLTGAGNVGGAVALLADDVTFVGR